MTTGAKVIIVAVIIVVLVAAPTEAADLVGDLFAGVLRFLRELG